MGRFQGLGATNAGGGLYFEAGAYEIEVRKVLFKQNRSREDCFIIETKVIKSDNPNRPVGCTPSVVFNFRHDMAPVNVKRFVAAALEIADVDGYQPEDGQSKDDFWDASTEFVVSEANPLEGMRLGLVCVNTKTKAQKDFTLHQWGQVTRRPGEQAA